MFQQALELAKTCNPTFEFQCQVPVASALLCGGPITCGARPPEPIGAYCSSDGTCVDIFPE